MRKNGSRREGGNADLKKVPNTNEGGRESMHCLRPHGSNGGLHGEKRLPDLQTRSKEMVGNVDTIKNLEGPGGSFTKARMMGGMRQYPSRSSGKQVVMVEGV